MFQIVFSQKLCIIKIKDNKKFVIVCIIYHFLFYYIVFGSSINYISSFILYSLLNFEGNYISILRIIIFSRSFLVYFRKHKSKKSSKKSPLAVSFSEDKESLMKESSSKDQAPLFYIAEDETDDLLKSERKHSDDTGV